MTIDVFVALATASAAIAAVCSAVAAFRVPRQVAIMAEKMRSDSQLEDDKRRLQNGVFVELMKVRRLDMNREAVMALNLIDYGFRDSRKVRDAYSALLDVYQRSASYNEQQDALDDLILHIANELGFGEGFTVADVKRVYVPNKIMDLQEIERLEIKDRLKDKSN